MNEDEVKALVVRGRRNPALAPYAQYLLDWVEIVNRHSDGWPYWVAGRRAGSRLAALIEEALSGTTVIEPRWNRAMGDIKRTASLQKRHGNTVPVPTLQGKEAA